ncbi:hypothetical protein [Psychrobacillus sp. FJAT-51614]
MAGAILTGEICSWICKCYELDLALMALAAFLAIAGSQLFAVVSSIFNR